MTTGSVIRGENERDERSGSQAGLKKKVHLPRYPQLRLPSFFLELFFFFTSSPKLSAPADPGREGPDVCCGRDGWQLARPGQAKTSDISDQMDQPETSIGHFSSSGAPLQKACRRRRKGAQVCHQAQQWAKGP